MDERPSNQAPSPVPPADGEAPTRMGERLGNVAQQLEDEVRRIEQHAQQLDDEARDIERETLLSTLEADGNRTMLMPLSDIEAALQPQRHPERDEAEPPLDEPDDPEDLPDATVRVTSAQTFDEDAYRRLSRHNIPDPTAEPIPVEPTTVRPRADVPDTIEPVMDDEGHFVVRNTRDYDHDAQSVNTAASAANFETLRADRSQGGTRRDPYARSARKGVAPGEGNSRSKLRPLLALLLVAVVLGAAGGVLTYGMELWGGKRVPNVVGESQATAESMLAEKGLVARFEAEPADDAIGKVLSQDPELGTRLPEGSEVTVVIATNRTIPEVVGMSEQDARALLAEAGAENLEVKTKQSSEAEGTVLAVSPEAGQPFVSRSVVRLTVATPFRVPDVVGKKESDAVDAIKAAGLSAEVTYVPSSETVRTVVSTSPSAGEVIAEGGTVQVQVSSPYPTDPMHLAEFFGHSSQDVDSFLQSKGYAFNQGFIDSYGNALATYTSGGQGNITFSSQPYTRNLALPKEGSSNVMATGVPIAGVRVDFGAGQIPGGYGRDAIDELVRLCGFGPYDVSDNSTIVVPAGAPKINATFICASGRMDNLVWTIVIVGNNNVKHASATCAKEGLYPSSELSKFGGIIRNFVAYQEVYLSPEFQVKEEKKDDKKDDKKDGDKKDEDGEKKEGEDASQTDDGQQG